MSLAHQETCRTCRKTIEVVLQCSLAARSCIPSVGDHLIVHSHYHIRAVKLQRHMSRLPRCRSGDLIPCRLVASDSVHSCLPVPSLRRIISDPCAVVDVCPAVYDREIGAAAICSPEICEICIDLAGPERL